MTHYWLSCRRMTVRVGVEQGRIVEAAPIVRKFVGEQLLVLVGWMRGLGGFEMAELPTERLPECGRCRENQDDQREFVYYRASPEHDRRQEAHDWEYLTARPGAGTGGRG